MKKSIKNKSFFHRKTQQTAYRNGVHLNSRSSVWPSHLLSKTQWWVTENFSSEDRNKTYCQHLFNILLKIVDRTI